MSARTDINVESSSRELAGKPSKCKAELVIENPWSEMIVFTCGDDKPHEVHTYEREKFHPDSENGRAGVTDVRVSWRGDARKAREMEEEKRDSDVRKASICPGCKKPRNWEVVFESDLNDTHAWVCRNHPECEFAKSSNPKL